ncbi:MAG: RNA-binding protein [Candidatus Methanomethylicota archaeon]|uniref:Exosome complex component Rrp4 n=1 Tax=Thermoproteota archaeon TaxID=2056631 RepID=A0A497EU11_9CREN|nr:MAG: RNA-binding protein [Candidatus Verstraetearchaeota archaeon]RLE51997.1 MAG: RNA-binding protein [Candidatus Verstraetearchaeota archaeon]
MTIFFTPKQVVAPGDLLAEGDYQAGENVYRDGKRLYASAIGLAELKNKAVSVVSLRGRYMPKQGDLVIGNVIDVSLTSWLVDINAPYNAVLFASEFLSKPINPAKEDIRKHLDVGEMIVAKILAFDRTKDPALTAKGRGLGKIKKGIVLEVDVTRIPRIIGRKGSMINMLKKETGCQITIGQNGRIWIRGKTPEDEAIAANAIKKIEREAHISGLTDRVRAYILQMRSKS